MSLHRSFGVLLWEVMTLGQLPYPGRGNTEVMQLVMDGGRLDSPSNCPAPVYGVMCQCWQRVPEERPSFTTVLERLDYCLQVSRMTTFPYMLHSTAHPYILGCPAGGLSNFNLVPMAKYPGLQTPRAYRCPIATVVFLCRCTPETPHFPNWKESTTSRH